MHLCRTSFTVSCLVKPQLGWVYFHALLIHCPVQHELVCRRSTNVESEERIFKSAEAYAKCTDRKPESMLPRVLMRLQSKRSAKTGNPLQSLHESNSRIAQTASRLPHFKGTVFRADFMKKHKYAYQAHLLVQGEGAWWHIWLLQMAVCVFMMAMMTLRSFMQVQSCCTFAILTWRMSQGAQEPAGKKLLRSRYSCLSLMLKATFMPMWQAFLKATTFQMMITFSLV